MNTFVTRAELLEAISTLGKEIAGLREDNVKLRQEMAQMETHITRFTAGSMIGGMTVMTAIFGVIVALAMQSL